ncbi:DUF924 family protein [Massilia sp. DWR3-1-1]|uniref:DUF924 family protein n=1 Tax=Massilia sp. DWR3-1-1 TaxID=2804559 RepID=UPI003CE848B8
MQAFDEQAQQVLDFWFLPASDPQHGAVRAAWFRKDDAFDAAIGARFGHLIDIAVAGGLREWDLGGPQGVLARILVLDQFTRNAHRGQPKSFAGDALALAAAAALVDGGADARLTPLQRWFAYMPFEHAEDARMQERAVSLFTALAGADAQFNGALDFALRHRGVIARFGRFPHRNAILGRASSADELAFLQQPGSGF